MNSNTTRGVLRDLRSKVKKSGLSHRQIAKAASVDRNYLAEVLEGDRSPTLAWVDRVLAALPR